MRTNINKKNKKMTITLTMEQLRAIVTDAVNLKISPFVKSKITNTKFNYLKLKRDENGRFLPKYRTFAYFTYPSSQWPGSKVGRKVIVESMDQNYIKGLDTSDNTFKTFRKDRIPSRVRIKKIKL